MRRKLEIGDRVKTPLGHTGEVESMNNEPDGYFERKYGEGCWVRMDEEAGDALKAFGINPGARFLRYYGFHELKKR